MGVVSVLLRVFRMHGKLLGLIFEHHVLPLALRFCNGDWGGSRGLIGVHHCFELDSLW
jgi:hypothetical protein